jgi:DnaJ homolog subfamily C member 7
VRAGYREEEVGRRDSTSQVKVHTFFISLILIEIHFSDALRLEQNHPDVLAVRGLALFLTNKMQAAMEHLKSALKLDQEHARARNLLRRAKDVEKKKDEGNTAFKAGMLGTAADRWTETLDM